MPRLVAWLAPLRKCLCRNARGGSSYHVSERIVVLRREIVNLERRLVLGRGSLGRARVAGNRIAQLRSLFFARLMVGFARALRWRPGPQKTGRAPLEGNQAKSGTLPLAARIRDGDRQRTRRGRLSRSARRQSEPSLTFPNWQIAGTGPRFRWRPKE